MGRIQAVEEGFDAKLMLTTLVIGEKVAAMLPPTFKRVEIDHRLLAAEADAIHGVHLRDQSFRRFHRRIVGPEVGGLFCPWLHWIGF
jgi:hypothetical protein